MIKAIYVLLFSFLILSCGNDDEETCIMCTSDQTTDFEVCQRSDGDASVNGENTNTDYDVYLADLMQAGAMCGG
ncbi:hypothetical protein ACFQO1_00715 [Jejudonia soesokkakensis]|uniref:Uncharacterized protein n=1 Tax=Jejudonia soesokkakensis TaxID=1323432 RepID=A0ABW2MN78_9FLAO